MPRRVTIQDIASEMGLSRNTVSKAINGTGIIADATRDSILKKAMEMGYKLFTQIPVAEVAAGIGGEAQKELVILTGATLSGSHFSARMLDEMQVKASLLGYGFTIYRVMPQERADCRLPANFDTKRVAGIFCLEMFDTAYSQMLCALEIPLVFIDNAVTYLEKPLAADCLLMENRSGIYRLVKEMADRGKTEIGFIGEKLHCLSFYERYDAYMGALRMFGLPFRDEWCLTGESVGLEYPSHDEYTAYLERCLRNCEKLPSLFICANDFVALDALQMLKKLGKSVPNDLFLCGFDDAPESRIITPSLTTIHINAQAMGQSAIDLLFSRMKDPALPFRTVYVESSLVYRESTGD
ncbi:MAG: LacI family DNA-binding transcriptional regulator [Treponema sp.]|uniref:LacI family DNA-binding transcriptional regulator n=1 Tax=Treponema sp. TaxID=166 RepID=UPI0025FD51F4|nr:LacI family DNA-binding transcriptional regulator [Treponema sp.]MBQ9280735.1 LacI family DNA-binding transcriptional regulator [Treponema sp.]